MTSNRTLPQSDSQSGIGYLLTVQIAAAAVLGVWNRYSGTSAAVVGTVATALIGSWWCCTRIRAVRSFWTRIMFRINMSRSRSTQTGTAPAGRPSGDPAPFGVDVLDVPAAGGPLTDALVPAPIRAARSRQDIGVSVSAGMLVTVIRVRPTSPAIRHLTRTGRDSGPGTEPQLALAPLAECLAQFDIVLHSIDVLVHTPHENAPDPVSRSYAETLGPMRSIPRTSTYVVVRLDPRSCTEAIARRGGGADGTLRTVAVATRRVAARINEQGLTADVLAAADIPGVLHELTCGRDQSCGREHWDHLNSDGLRCRTIPVDRGGAAERYAAIDSATHPAVGGELPSDVVATTTVINLTGTAEAPYVRALTRMVTTAGEGLPPTEPDPAPETHALCGHQAVASFAGLLHPDSHTVWHHVAPVRGSAATQLVRRTALPCSGSGQLLGADREGRPVALPLAGPGVSRVIIDAQWPLAAQIVLRAIATGARIVLHTDDQTRWQPIIATVDSPDRLSAVPTEPTGLWSPVHVYDGRTPPEDSPGVTIFHIRGQDDDSARPGDTPSSTVFIRQDRHDQRSFSVDTHTGTTTLSVVAVDYEWTIIAGRPAISRPTPARPVPRRPIPVPPAPVPVPQPD